MESNLDSGYRFLGSAPYIVGSRPTLPLVRSSLVWRVDVVSARREHLRCHSIFRQRDQSDGYVGYRGVPRWVVTLFGDEVDPPRKTINRPE
jgi:hypothetical protein